MPRIVSEMEKSSAIKLMLAKDANGNFLHGQREIERQTGLSRPYLRSIAKSIGHQFPRNGIEVKGQVCMCTNCGFLFRRPKSKVDRAKHQFCHDICKYAYNKGEDNPDWGKNAYLSSIVESLKSKPNYESWKKNIIESRGNKCEISNSTNNLEVYYIFPRYDNIDKNNPFTTDVLVMDKEVHNKIVEKVRDGIDFNLAISKVQLEHEAEGVAQDVTTSSA